jgi:hypothetical protein
MFLSDVDGDLRRRLSLLLIDRGTNSQCHPKSNDRSNLIEVIMASTASSRRKELLFGNGRGKDGSTQTKLCEGRRIQTDKGNTGTTPLRTRNLSGDPEPLWSELLLSSSFVTQTPRKLI